MLQDNCRLLDSIWSAKTGYTSYYTGSRSEGLDLPGSDDDYMLDVNYMLNFKVVQSVHEISDASICEEFFMCTENVKPGFALLRRVRQHTVMQSPVLKAALKTINNVEYLSSDYFVNDILHTTQSLNIGLTTARQGPSMETRWPHMDSSQPGDDCVPSIHCCFWPNDASEWIQRSRSFEWPTSDVMSSIVDFGCHLVAVGHPQSATKLSEWRISFSIAEKHLVWSFNHIQMQCYAVLKIVLKQYIKLKCSPQNQVLCSYFIKTFLFWKYETTPLEFWCKSNFWECIVYLLREFSKCIREGVIRHYFLPRFNLLSVKLTPEAQTELLLLYDIVIQYDINILRECNAMRSVWSKFLLSNENQMKIINDLKKYNLLLNDALMLTKLHYLTESLRDDYSYFLKKLFDTIFPHIEFASSASPSMRQLMQPLTTNQIRNRILNLPCKTCLKCLFLKYLCLKTEIESIISVHQGNKMLYMLQKNNQINASFDVSTRQLWHAIIVLKTLDYNATLNIVNRLLSIIPPCALYLPISGETISMYANKFLNSTSTQMQRARDAWLMDIAFDKCMSDILPLAIQIELYFCRVDGLRYTYDRVKLSPYVCSYYLRFLCYHELGQYENRDHALHQLIEVVNNRLQCGSRRDFSYNIAGYCLLVTGQIDRARDMFNRSLLFRMTHAPLRENYSSANWYITNFC